MKIEKLYEYFKAEEQQKYSKYPEFLQQKFDVKYAELFDIFRDKNFVRIDFNLGQNANIKVVKQLIDYFVGCDCSIHADSDEDVIYVAVIPFNFFEEVIDIEMEANKYNL